MFSFSRTHSELAATAAATAIPTVSICWKRGSPTRTRTHSSHTRRYATHQKYILRVRNLYFISFKNWIIKQFTLFRCKVHLIFFPAAILFPPAVRSTYR